MSSNWWIICCSPYLNKTRGFSSLLHNRFGFFMII